MIGRSTSLIEKLTDDPGENEVREIQEILAEARIIGVYIPQSSKLQLHIENFDRTKEIKTMISNSKNYSFTEARSFYDNLVKQMEKTPRQLGDLKDMIDVCQN